MYLLKLFLYLFIFSLHRNNVVSMMPRLILLSDNIFYFFRVYKFQPPTTTNSCSSSRRNVHGNIRNDRQQFGEKIISAADTISEGFLESRDLKLTTYTPVRDDFFNSQLCTRVKTSDYLTSPDLYLYSLIL